MRRVLRIWSRRSKVLSHREVKENSEALKYNNSRLLQVERLTEAVYQTLSKFPAQKLDNFELTVQKFEAATKTLALSADKINEALSRLGDTDDPKKLDEKQCKLGEYVDEFQGTYAP